VTTLAGDQPSLPLAIGDFSRAFRPLLVPPPAPAARPRRERCAPVGARRLRRTSNYAKRNIRYSDTRIGYSDTRREFNRNNYICV